MQSAVAAWCQLRTRRARGSLAIWTNLAVGERDNKRRGRQCLRLLLVMVVELVLLLLVEVLLLHGAQR